MKEAMQDKWHELQSKTEHHVSEMRSMVEHKVDAARDRQKEILEKTAEWVHPRHIARHLRVRGRKVLNTVRRHFADARKHFA